jgi:hypothetical protein
MLLYLVINDTIHDAVDCNCNQEMPKNVPKMPTMNIVCITGAEVRACKDVDTLLSQKFKKPEDTPILNLAYAMISCH